LFSFKVVGFFMSIFCHPKFAPQQPRNLHALLKAWLPSKQFVLGGLPH
jgi:hypothetical protein